MTGGQAAQPDFEGMLRQALVPVEPPEALHSRVEATLQELTDLAFDQLEAWELSAMRDPRNWVAPVAAGVVGAGAGTALVVMRVRQQRSRRRSAANDPLDLVARTFEAAVGEARKLARR